MWKNSCAFIDLLAVYDTVWREGLIYKLMKAILCFKTCRLIHRLPANRLFLVYINDTKSNVWKLNNGLPQRSILVSILFNIYTVDRALAFKKLLTNVADKVKTRNKKARWNDMRCYSGYTPNLCVSYSILNGWILGTSMVRKRPRQKDQVLVNQTMRMITGIVKSTPVW